MDIKSAEDRSKNMSRIRCKKTKPEMFVRSLLFRKGFRYRVNYSMVVGSPDIYFSKKKIAIFINGCFWHRHQNCKYAYTPKSNIEFWNAKFIANQKRDELVRSQLLTHGIRVLVVWECTVKRMMSDPLVCDVKSAEILMDIGEENQKYIEL